MPEWITKYWVEWLFGVLIAILTWVVKRTTSRVKREQEQNEACATGCARC